MLRIPGSGGTFAVPDVPVSAEASPALLASRRNPIRSSSAASSWVSNGRRWGLLLKWDARASLKRAAATLAGNRAANRDILAPDARACSAVPIAACRRARRAVQRRKVGRVAGRHATRTR